ncbi:MAG: glycosyltransferase [Taibaiella sp.]|jgi:mannosyltransferase OCH1-like enzyme
MAIPKIIFQTFRSKKLPFITRQFIKLMKLRNPAYRYEFYDDERIEMFMLKEFDDNVYQAYKRIDVGAVKADFFRYAILYKYGGIYLDIDGYTISNLDKLIREDDHCIITHERNPGLYAQYALVFSAGHPFLKRTLEKVVDNINHNRFPHDGHMMTGPTVFTEAINECIAENATDKYRILGVDYEGFLRSRYPFRKALYKKGEHWREAQQLRPILKN